MTNKKKNFTLYLFLAALLISGLVVYKDILPLYFQQDEWHSFGWLLYSKGTGTLSNLKTIFLENSRPLARGVFALLFEVFGLNEAGYNATSVVLHLANSFVLFLLVQKLVRQKTIALISTGFFLFNSTHLQSITWISASFGSLYAGLFGLISLHTFINYLEEKNRRFYFLTIFFLVVSMAFKEIVLSFFLIYPSIDYLVNIRVKDLRALVEEYWLMLIVGIFWILSRLWPVLFSYAESPYLTAESEGGGFLLEVLINLFTYPIQSVSQIFIYPQTMYNWTNELTKIFAPGYGGNDLFIQTIGSGILSFILGVAILLTGIVIYKSRDTKKNIRKALLIGLILTPLSVLPFVLLPKSTSYLETRNYYLITVGGALLFGVFVWQISKYFNENLELSKKYLHILLIVLVTPYMWMQVGFIREHVNNLKKQGVERKNIISKILNTYPEISDKALFYTESDSYYYGPSNPTMPFQSGFGHVVLVSYIYEGELSPKLLAEDYLWGIWDQGYKEGGQYGFGYFREYNRLLTAIKENNLRPENIYAFSWKEGRIINITSEMRNKIRDNL